MKHPALLLSFLLTLPLAAQEPSPRELQLREQLRATAIQLRTAATEKANAVATLAAAESKNQSLQKEIDDLNTRLATLTKRASEDKTTSDQALATLNQKLKDAGQQIQTFSAAIEKWKDAYEKLVAAARQTEAARISLAAENTTLKNTVADRERKNLTLYSTALEILDRYQNYALGRAIGAREPFIQRTRVKVETQVEGYKNTVIDNRIAAP